uniref:LAGLIDADG homing endonuclease n=1 Tax=Auxenochlorella protothecoides TaxID=3075 RepID=A0A1Z1GBM0_AUXPR|nr:LAGLIDADG homing endonuclease [Auxenochlorella protothecoides]
MDDGSKLCYNKDYPRKGFVLNTQGFKTADVILASQEIFVKFNIITKIR